MGGRYVFDCETDGFLEKVTRVHCLVLRNIDTDEVLSFADQPCYRPIEKGLELLREAELTVGHNRLCFDDPVLRKIYPGFEFRGHRLDTLTISRLIFTDIKDRDFAQARRGFPGYLIGSHSLKAWGFRLGVYKGNYGETADWSRWTEQMQSYCVQDTVVTKVLFERIQGMNYSAEAIQLEHDFQEIIFKQEQIGWKINEKAAEELYLKLLSRKGELTKQLQDVFPPTKEETKTPEYYEAFNDFVTLSAPTKTELYERIKKDGLRAKDFEFKRGPVKVKSTPFNPGSRDQIADRLKALGWNPVHTTDTGKAKVDDEILDGCNIPEAKLLSEYLMVTKRASQIGGGDKAWLKMVRRGRLHGRMITNGAVTGRCTHMDPNLGQVPAVGVPYGTECRAVFETDTGFVLVGSDASGLELRCLAHYMAQWDKGAYALIVTQGDVHTENQKAAGLESRGQAKTFIYAYLYGAGDHKLGSIVYPEGVPPEIIERYEKTEKDRWRNAVKLLTRIEENEGKAFDANDVAKIVHGNILRTTFQTRLPALGSLVDAVKAKAKERKYLIGLDGRKLHVRHQHSALNTLLQSAGALIMKKATVLLHDQCLNRNGWDWGIDWAQLGHIHDEIQCQVRPEIAEKFGQLSVEAIREAGRHFKFLCPLDGAYKIGRNWAETH
jgi:DNA polymerase I